MTSLEELRRRVQAAQSAVGQLGSEGRDYGDRLSGLVDGLNERLRRQDEELAALRAERDALARESGELRDMLTTLLAAVEDGGGDRLGAAMRTLYERLSGLSDATAEGDAAGSSAAVDWTDPPPPAEDGLQSAADALAVHAAAGGTEPAAAVVSGGDDAGDATAPADMVRAGGDGDVPAWASGGTGPEQAEPSTPTPTPTTQ